MGQKLEDALARLAFIAGNYIVAKMISTGLNRYYHPLSRVDEKE